MKVSDSLLQVYTELNFDQEHAIIAHKDLEEAENNDLGTIFFF